MNTMFFKKKSKNNDDKCISCGKNSNTKYNFCPHCGESKMDEADEAKDFGLIGKTDNIESMNPLADAGVFERIISMVMQSAVKTLANEMQNPNSPKPEIQNMPNGIRITLNQPKQNKPQKSPENKITQDQLKKISSLPKSPAKTSVKRFNDKLVYELSASGIESLNDIFISKLENGYEIKAIGKNRVYVNTIPVNLQLIKYGLTDNSILLEFNSNQ